MNHNSKILIVDDEANIRDVVELILSPLAQKIDCAGSAEEALECLRNECYDVVVSDIRMPGMDGLTFLQTIKEEQPRTRFLMITAHGNMDIVIQAMRLGASDFLNKPFDNKELKAIVQRLLNCHDRDNEPLYPSIENKRFIGKSDSFLKATQIASRAALTDSTILLLGESGTGKEMFAKFIHESSQRKDEAFIAINCGAIPENLIESELFGYEKGAFSGAVQAKPGKFELAQKGTLFLDEIGELPLSMQVKLLRVLQERTLERVGATKSTALDIRLIAATNRSLEDEIRKGTFREDLYYRLNIIPIHLPPLRERIGDVELLAHFFVKKFNERYLYHYQLEDHHIKKLNEYHWPGNIRELENIMERSVVLGFNNQLDIQLPQTSSSPHSSSPEPTPTYSISAPAAPKNHGDYRSTQKDVEKNAILEALKNNRWNKTKTAEAMGMSRRSLLYKIKEYQIE